MANYNTDEPKERGFWYDVQITRMVSISIPALILCLNVYDTECFIP